MFVFNAFIRVSISFSVQCIDNGNCLLVLSKGGSALCPSLTVVREAKESFKQSAFALSVKWHYVSPEGRVEERGGIGEDELLFLTKCLYNLPKFLFMIVFKVRNE